MFIFFDSPSTVTSDITNANANPFIHRRDMDSSCMHQIYLCKDCYRTLDHKGIVKEEYIALLELFLMSDDLIFEGETKGKVNSIITYLEENGFIISTEIDQSLIKIKPIGHMITNNNEHTFCAFRKDHHK